MRNSPLLTCTNVIILCCVIAYAAEQLLFSQGNSGFELFYFENPNFSPWQLLSHMFLHGSPTHLFFNMFGLWMFGNALETVWGAKKFMIFYVICGLGAAIFFLTLNYFQFQSAIQPLLDENISKETLFSLFSKSQYYPSYPTSEDAVTIFQSPVVGASGALYGVLVGFAFLFPNHKIMLLFLPVPIAAKFFVPALLWLDIFSEFTGFSIFGQNIAHAAHVGGAITGVILMITFIRKRWNNRHQRSIGVWRQ